LSTKIQLSFGVRQYAIADGCTIEVRVSDILYFNTKHIFYVIDKLDSIHFHA